MASASPVGQQLAIVPTEHQEVTVDVGPSQEDDTEGGIGTGHIRKVLSRGNTCGVVVVYGGGLVLSAPMAHRLEGVHVGFLR